MSTLFLNSEGIYYKNKKICVFEKQEGLRYKDTIREQKPGFYEWNRVYELAGCEKQDYQTFCMSCRIEDKVNYYMIPGILYNGNRWGDGKEPKGLARNGQDWVFGYHRASVPAGMYGQTENYFIGIWACVGEMHYSCSISEDEQSKQLVFSLYYPEREEPQTYCARDRYEDAYMERTVHCGKTITMKAMVTVGERKKLYDFGTYFSNAWEFYKVQSKRQISNEQTWELGIDFIMNQAYFKTENFSGFCMGLTFVDGRWRPKKDYLEIGWVGQNASLAVSLLYQHLFTGDTRAFQQGIDTLDCWAEQATLPNGLFRCHFEKIQKYGTNIENQEECNDAANLYSVVEQYLEAEKVLSMLEIRRDNYKELVKRLCDFLCRKQDENGAYGKAWYNNGTCIQKDGTIGCYLAKALCIAFESFEDEKYKESAVRAFNYYYTEFLQNGFTTAGALDTCCIDKESAIGLLGTAIRLFQYTGEQKYAEAAKLISAYLASWQYHYNVSFPSDSVLAQITYKTRGGTCVSTQHHHIDCYGLAFYEDWMHLAALTGEIEWKERAEEIWNNSLYNISDGTKIIKGQRRPKGSQDEGFLQTRWHTKRGDYFGVSEWLVVWNTAFRLEILRRAYLVKWSGFDKLRENDCTKKDDGVHFNERKISVE